MIRQCRRLEWPAVAYGTVHQSPSKFSAHKGTAVQKAILRWLRAARMGGGLKGGGIGGRDSGDESVGESFFFLGSVEAGVTIVFTLDLVDLEWHKGDKVGEESGNWRVEMIRHCWSGWSTLAAFLTPTWVRLDSSHSLRYFQGTATSLTTNMHV